MSNQRITLTSSVYNLKIHSSGKFKLTSVGLYSLTAEVQADYISNHIRAYFTEDLDKYDKIDATITDANACIGGNVLSFSKYFNKVNAIELDPLNYDVLNENIKLLAKEQKINTIKGDFLNEIFKLDTDIIFLDPPFGGTDYKESSTVSMAYGTVNLNEVISNLSKICNLLVIKVPYNSDLNVEQASKFFNYTELVKITSIKDDSEIYRVYIFSNLQKKTELQPQKFSRIGHKYMKYKVKN